MDIPKILMIFQVVLAVFLITTILLQSRGASLGEAWGGSSAFYASRRGVDRVLFILTIIFASLFVTLAMVSLLMS